MASTITLDLAGLRDEITNLVVDKLDLGATDATGDLVILDGSSTVLVTIVLANPAFGASAAGAATLAGVPLTGTAVAAGSAVTAQLRDRDNAIVFSGPVAATGGGGLVELDKLNIEVGDDVTVTAGTLTTPAS